MPTQPRVIAVIVAYLPNPGTLAQLIATIGSQVDGIVLVCNSEIELSDKPAISKCAVTTIKNQSNIGLAAAQNLGLNQCLVEGADFVLFLDQDSIPGAELVRDLMAADSLLSERGFAVGAVAPLLVDADTGTVWPYLSAGYLYTRESTKVDCYDACRADMLYSSGSLVRLTHFRTVGQFMEPLFIDHVDLEWCYRAAQHGLEFFGIPAIQMRHRMGNGHVRFLGRLHPIHSATRDFFVFRNSVILLGLKHIPLRWKINEVLRLIPRCIFYGLINGTLVQHVSSCMRGIAAGISHHLNRSKPSVAHLPPRQ